MKKIAFYVSGRAGRLRKLLESIKYNPVLKATKLVVCDNLENSDLRKIFNKLKIEFREIDYSNFHKDKRLRGSVFSDYLNNEFLNYKIDYCFCFGSHILKGELLKNYRNKIINFHPSILPNFPGKLSIDQALGSNFKLLGNTAHFVDENVDTGPIIMQNVVHREIFEKDGYEGVLSQQLPMLSKIFICLQEDRIKIKNNTVKIEGADYKVSTFYPII